jgi:DNA-directed RNA polymerase I subunit RPA43
VSEPTSLALFEGRAALNAYLHRLTVANQMLSLVGSIQPDPFSPEHVPQAKPDRVQSPRPPPGSLSEPIESEGAEEGEEVALATRGEKKREKEVEKNTKRKRKQDNAAAKSPKRKKTS